MLVVFVWMGSWTLHYVYLFLRYIHASYLGWSNMLSCIILYYHIYASILYNTITPMLHILFAIITSMFPTCYYDIHVSWIGLSLLLICLVPWLMILYLCLLPCLPLLHIYLLPCIVLTCMPFAIVVTITLLDCWFGY